MGATAIVAFVVQSLQDSKDAKATFMQVQQPAWVKPTQPWVKCNVDGSLFPGMDYFGFGIILRDHNRMFLKGISSFFTTT